MTGPLSLVVTIQASPGHEAEIAAALLGVVEQTRAEAGCVQYDLHRDPAQHGRFVFYETWASREAWEAHDAAEHIVALKQTLEAGNVETVLMALEKLEP